MGKPHLVDMPAKLNIPLSATLPKAVHLCIILICRKIVPILPPSGGIWGLGTPGKLRNVQLCDACAHHQRWPGDWLRLVAAKPLEEQFPDIHRNIFCAKSFHLPSNPLDFETFCGPHSSYGIIVMSQYIQMVVGVSFTPTMLVCSH